MTRTKILLTGAGGFLSSRIYKAYKDEYDIVPLTRKDLDITNHSAANRVIEEKNPDIIIHSAAIAATGTCENNPELAYSVNVEASLNIARKARDMGSKMLFISTEQIFNGNINEGPYNEDEKAVPDTVYGKTKLRAEELLRKELDRLWIIRLSWMFGFPERGVSNNPNLFWKLFNAAILNEPIKVAANEYRAITYVYELIDNLEKIFTLPFDTYHFGSENEKSTYETAVFMLEKIGVSQDRIQSLVIKDEEKYRDKKRDLRMSYDKIKSFGIDINTSWGAIERAIDEFNFKINK